MLIHHFSKMLIHKQDFDPNFWSVTEYLQPLDEMYLNMDKDSKTFFFLIFIWTQIK